MCLAAQRTDTTVHLDTARVCPQRRALFCLEVAPGQPGVCGPSCRVVPYVTYRLYDNYLGAELPQYTLSEEVKRPQDSFLCRHAFPLQCATTERCWSVWFDVANVHHHSRLPVPLRRC